MRPSLEDLADHDAFVARHIGPSAADQAVMLAELGLGSLDDLIDQVVPTALRLDAPLDLPGPRPEHEVIAELRRIASRNRPVTSLIGQGYYGTITPAVIQRNVLENPAWYTAYTPYQPEISQGRLEALLNFQTMVADLTGMDLSNASLLDEATAAAEAMAMSRRLSKLRGERFFVDADVHPQTLAVLATRAEPTGVELVVGSDPLAAAGCFGALLSYPGSTGAVRDLGAVIAELQAGGTVVTVTTDLLACVLVTPPGRMGADIVVGSAQRFGVPMGFGGPHAAFMAVRETHARSLPGRLVGVSTDSAGRPALRLALQTREQHIRRERATSNICTAQVLLANIAGFYATYHGADGLTRIAERTHRLTSLAAAGLAAGGHPPVNDTWFDTLTIAVPDAEAVHQAAAALDLNLRHIDDQTIGLSFDETSTVEVVEKVWHAFGITTDTSWFADAPSGIPESLRRTDTILDHAVFHAHHSEHAMLRYLRRLADRDLALDRTMIPLGSCTMKLNATSEMLAITWPEFADIHPYAPSDQVAGYAELIAGLEAALLACTGYDAISLQPNAGSQGEFAGLLAIRAHHRANGQAERDVCLIPSSAHGTNAASAVMAGLRVVVVACDTDGNVDVDDLHAKIDQHRGQLAAIMVTYPSTHGVFEPAIEQICAAVHAAGGQVYVDGANLNALVGLAKPGKFGADVSHLNLHKTFCIPHGGGGPGVGPVAVRAHLAPYLPGHPLAPVPAGGVGAVAAAPQGSASILPISWAYVSLMGGSGLTAATKTAILAANYMAHRLDPHFPVLYRGEHGYVGHECIVDLRPLTKRTGVTVDDVAKRLMDFGFHAPTVSFPVSGTLMIEPTESEPLAEIDRFCSAMIAIRAEIEAVESGAIAMDDSPLRHAPHTVGDLVDDSWDRSYPRSIGAYPDGDTSRDRYFPPVSRIDAAYGDRNLVCDCGPIEAYAATVRSHG